MMALIGTLAYEFQVVLPVLARDAFHGNASTYGFMTSAMGVGAVGGGLVTAVRGRIGLRPLTVNAAAFGLLILVAAAAPTLAVEMVALVGVGAASVSFLAVGNTTLQLTAKPTMRGRVMALWAVAFLGSTPVGGAAAGRCVGQRPAGSARAGLSTEPAASRAGPNLGSGHRSAQTAGERPGQGRCRAHPHGRGVPGRADHHRRAAGTDAGPARPGGWPARAAPGAGRSGRRPRDLPPAGRRPRRLPHPAGRPRRHHQRRRPPAPAPAAGQRRPHRTREDHHPAPHPRPRTDRR